MLEIRMQENAVEQSAVRRSTAGRFVEPEAVGSARTRVYRRRQRDAVGEVAAAFERRPGLPGNC